MADLESLLKEIAKNFNTLERRLKILEARPPVDDSGLFGRFQALTIASGVITPAAHAHYVLRPETGSTDDLATITATRDGQLLFLRVESGKTITVKNGTGNITLPGGDIVLDSSTKLLALFFVADAALWRQAFYNTASGGGATTLDGLTDVTITTPVDGYVLTYSTASGQWIDAVLPSGSTPALNDLTDVIITAPADNDFLVYDTGSGQWVNLPISGVVSTTIPLIQSEFGSDDATTASTTSFASKGIVFQPSEAMKLYGVNFFGPLVASGEYRLTLATINTGTGVIGTVLATKTFTHTVETTLSHLRQMFWFATPQALTAGTDYLVMFTRTNSALTTTALNIDADANSRIPFNINNDPKNTAVIADLDPIAGDTCTLNTAVTPFVFGWVWSINSQDKVYAPA